MLKWVKISGLYSGYWWQPSNRVELSESGKYACFKDSNHNHTISDLEQIIAKMREVQGNGVQESS